MGKKRTESSCKSAVNTNVENQLQEILNSKEAILQLLNSNDSEIRQACISSLAKNHPNDSSTIEALIAAQFDNTPLVRSTARIFLAQYYRSIGNDTWRSVMCDDVCDEQLDPHARVLTYIELLRLVGLTEKFFNLCKNLQSVTVADIDWQLLTKIKNCESIE